MPLDNETLTDLKCSMELLSSKPLYERVPTRDEEGNTLGDFMMLFPGLRDMNKNAQGERVNILAEILSQYKEVVYVDLNVPLNLLWVSIRHRPGLVLELSTYINLRIPEAKLVGVPPDALVRK